jgi:hypothetical protein
VTIALVALPQHMAVSLWLTGPDFKLFLRLRLRNGGIASRYLDSGNGEPEAHRHVLRHRRKYSKGVSRLLRSGDVDDLGAERPLDLLDGWVLSSRLPGFLLGLPSCFLRRR